MAVSRRSGANAKNPVRAPSRDVRTIVISDRKSPRWSYHCDFSSNSSSSPSPTSHDIILPEPMTSSSRAQAIPGTVQTGDDVMRIFENIVLQQSICERFIREFRQNFEQKSEIFLKTAF